MFNNDNNNYNSNASQFSGSQVQLMGPNHNINQENDQQTQNHQQIIPYDQRKLSQITIKQIINAKPPQKEEFLKIDGVPITQVLMFAEIVSIDDQITHTSFKVNDYTGSLIAKKWKNQEEEKEKEQQPLENKSPKLSKGTWVKIVGRINHYNGICTINVIEIMPVEDFNELTHHCLEIIYHHLENTVGHLDPRKQLYAKNNDALNIEINNFAEKVNNPNSGLNNNLKNMDMNINNNQEGVSGIQTRVLEIINKPKFANSDTGCNVEVIFDILSNENIDSIREAIDLLCESGYIYSTIDDEHYKYSG